MGKRAQKGTKINSRDNNISTSNNKVTCTSKTSKKEERYKTPKNLGNKFAKTVKRFGNSLSSAFKKLSDHRVKGKIKYNPSHFMWSIILMYTLHLGSRRQFREERKTKTFLKNLLNLSKTNELTIADPDTINNFLMKLPAEKLALLPSFLVKDLIRRKSLNYSRLYCHFTIALDGTGVNSFSKRHCEYCLTSTNKATGKTYYYHKVLAAKLVTRDGYAFSIEDEFIENPYEFPTKQDCEYNSFLRLAPRLKEAFPRMKFCLLLDGLFCNAPIFKICEDYGWKYIITFKAGSIPTLYEAAHKKKQNNLENRRTNSLQNKEQSFAWATDMQYKSFQLSAIYCHEKVRKKDGSLKVTDFVWVTNFDVDRSRVITLANQGGRLRWKIENEGFNAQKTGGYKLEHSYSLNENAAKCYYYLLQIAHFFNQIMVKGSLFVNFKKQMGSIKNYARRLAEHLRNLLIEDDIVNDNAFQIRLNSS